MDTRTKIVVEVLASGHDHLREGEVVGPLLEKTIEGGTDVVGPQPNTSAGLLTAAQVCRYTKQAKELVPTDKTLSIIPFVMITEATTKEEIDACVAAGIVDGKAYPKLRTTKSENGIVRYGKIIPAVKHAGRVGMRIHGHFEHPNTGYSNEEAEYAALTIARIFLEESEAQIFWEHGTDGRCIRHWEDMATSGRFFVTITPHHLAANADQVYGDVRAICKPSFGDEDDRLALIHLVEENYPWVMAGPDVAPHDQSKKHAHRGCCACGAYHAPFLLQLYAHALEHLLLTPEGVQTFINFTSRNLRRVCGLPPASRNVVLVRRQFEIPPAYQVGPWTVEPFWAGEKLNWSLGSANDL